MNRFIHPVYYVLKYRANPETGTCVIPTKAIPEKDNLTKELNLYVLKVTDPKDLSENYIQ